jgi:hypothetical protein
MLQRWSLTAAEFCASAIRGLVGDFWRKKEDAVEAEMEWPEIEKRAARSRLDELSKEMQLISGGPELDSFIHRYYENLSPILLYIRRILAVEQDMAKPNAIRKQGGLVDVDPTARADAQHLLSDFAELDQQARLWFGRVPADKKIELVRGALANAKDFLLRLEDVMDQLLHNVHPSREALHGVIIGLAKDHIDYFDPPVACGVLAKLAGLSRDEEETRDWASTQWLEKVSKLTPEDRGQHLVRIRVDAHISQETAARLNRAWIDKSNRGKRMHLRVVRGTPTANAE